MNGAIEVICPNCEYSWPEKIDCSLVVDLVDVLDFIEKRLWHPSEWELLQKALAVAVKPRGAS